MCVHCPDENKDLLYEPVPLEEHEVKILADAEGSAKSPAHVSVFLQRGFLHVTGGGGHTLEGVATGGMGDAPPRLELMQDRVALTQSTVGGSPPRADGKFMLAFGTTPMNLELDTGTGEVQTIDLGGVPVKQASFHTASGHLAIDWTAPNPLPGGRITLKTESGYIDVAHLGKSGATRIDVTDIAGYVGFDLGEFALSAPDLAIVAQVTSGMLVLKAPKTLAARATITSPPGSVVNKGWSSGEGEGSFLSGDPKAPARVTAQVTAAGGHVELRVE